MRKRTVLVLSGLAATAAIPVSSAAARVEERAPDSYIVVYDRSVAGLERQTDRRERSGGFKARFRYERALKGFSATLTPGQVRKLRSDPDVAYVSPDRIVRTTASEPLVAGGNAPLGMRRIDAATDAGRSVRQASTVGVAVLDSGVDSTHPDLNVGSGTNCATPGTAQGDTNGHGTHVAGTIAAKNDGVGVTGVAPGTRIHPVKVFAEGGGPASQVICGIEWVTANADALDIRVANMSLGSFGTPVGSCATTTDPQHQAICNSTAAGITYVVAAGNSRYSFDTAYEPFTPAAYPEVLTVTAISDTDGQGGGFGPLASCARPSPLSDRVPEERPASFSNYATSDASAVHTIAAPGVCVESTWPGGGYYVESGTSMASPHMAGTVALCLGEAGATGPCTGLTPAQIIQRVRADAQGATAAVPAYGYEGDPTRPFTGRYYGYMAWAGIPGSAPTTPVATADYSLSAAPASVSVRRGRQGKATITVTPKAGFSSPVALSAGGLPAGASASFSPSSTTSTSELTLTTSRSTPTGTYSLRIQGVGAGLSRTTTLTLTVT